MLGIVIPLKAQVAARNWHSTSAMLQQTLASLENQTDRNFRFAVVGHDCPAFLAGDDAYVDCNFDLPPLAINGSYQNRADFDRIGDKNRKIVRGLQALSHFSITHWFYLDADDLLHRDFVSTVAQFNSDEGAVFDRGYLLFARENRIMRHRRLSEICGSTSVLPASAFEIPSGLDACALAQVPWCRYSHKHMARCLAELSGVRSRNVEQDLVTYVLGHGDNASDEFRMSFGAALKSWLKPRVFGRRITKHFRCDFAYRNCE